MDGVITKQSEEYIMMMRILKKCSKEVLEFQDLPVPIANEVACCIYQAELCKSYVMKRG